MKNRINPKKNPRFINRAGLLIKDNTRIAKDGMAFYLDTLWKLPGAYAAGRDQMKSEKMLRRQIKSFDDIQAIKKNIDDSRAQINSIKTWVSLAKEGTWSKEVEKSIDDFGASSNELGEKVELFGLDYQYFVDSFLSCRKDELAVFFQGNGQERNPDFPKEKIIESLMQVGLLRDKVEETLAKTSDLEADVEKFVDSKLSRSEINKPRRRLRKAPSRARKLVTGFSDTVNRIALMLKLAVLGIYYVARAFVFMIRYFILLPASLIEGLLGVFKRKK